jgi:hypothetical protein
MKAEVYETKKITLRHCEPLWTTRQSPPPLPSLRGVQSTTKQSIIDNNTIIMKTIIFSLLWFWIAALTSLVHNDGNEQLI